MSSSPRLRRRTSVLCLLAVILSLVSWLAGAQSASAGGPTSVLLANPQNGRVAALYHTDAEYDRLVAALEAYEVNTGSTTPPGSIPNDFSNEIRLTWLIHDMTIWRIDRVHITDEDGVWVETVVQTDGGSLLEQPSKWHRAVNANALTAVLSKAGLLAKGAAPASGPEPMTTTATSTDESPATTPAPSSAWLAAATGIGGLLVGAAGSIVMLRRASRRTASEANNDRVVLTG